MKLKNDYILTISVKSLRDILGDYHYRKLAAGILRYGAPHLKGDERPVLVDSIPFSGMSREKRAAVLMMSEKKALPAVSGLNRKPLRDYRKGWPKPAPAVPMTATSENCQSQSRLGFQVPENRCRASRIPHQGGTNRCSVCIRSQSEAVRRETSAHTHCRCCRRFCPLYDEGLW